MEREPVDAERGAARLLARVAARREPFPLVITDVIMGKMSGLELLQEIQLLEPETLVVIMTSQATLETATEALRNGAYDFLIKPFDDLGLLSVVANRAIGRLILLEQNRSLMDRLKSNAEELERLKASLQELADHDGLTGLHNHRFFRDALDREIDRAQRHDRKLSLVFMDVDHFKSYNDTNGHLAGDEVLRTVATVLRERARSSTILARHGGEEFVAVVPETDKEGARVYAETIRRLIEEQPVEGEEGQPLGRLTISLGVATFPEDGDHSEALIDRADTALYQAKEEGRNRVRG